MADGHVGYVMPIGGVAAYDNKASVVGVGFDIACGNAAIRTNLKLAVVRLAARSSTLADEIQRVDLVRRRSQQRIARTTRRRTIRCSTSPAWDALREAAGSTSTTRSRPRRASSSAPSAAATTTWTSSPTRPGRVWVGVHFGSRGLGHTIASGFLALSQNKPWGERAKEVETLLDLSAPLGEAYWDAMQLAGAYAYAGREWVARSVVDLLGGREMELVHNHHNFAWRELHEGRELVVVRKGATPAFPGQRGFIGGSMGDDAVIVEGAVHGDAALQRASLYSTVHGAGRVMSRTEARGKVKGWGPRARIVSPGKVSWEMVKEWLGPRGVILRGGGLDEAPQAYRRLPDVLAAQGDTIRVLHTLRPIIVVMAGENEFDPYKD